MLTLKIYKNELKREKSFVKHKCYADACDYVYEFPCEMIKYTFLASVNKNHC